jgi:hypothetical protein
MNGEPKAMENRVDACRRINRGTVKTAFSTSSAVAMIAGAVLLIVKVAKMAPNQMTWGEVLLSSVLAFMIVFVMMLWNFGRAMKRSRALDQLNPLPPTSVGE